MGRVIYLSSEIASVQIPIKMWRFFQQQVEANDFCYFCNNHPSHEHDKNCPLFKEEKK